MNKCREPYFIILYPLTEIVIEHCSHQIVRSAIIKNTDPLFHWIKSHSSMTKWNFVRIRLCKLTKYPLAFDKRLKFHKILEYLDLVFFLFILFGPCNEVNDSFIINLDFMLFQNTCKALNPSLKAKRLVQFDLAWLRNKLKTLVSQLFEI
jgi:hypothetical protein